MTVADKSRAVWQLLAGAVLAIASLAGALLVATSLPSSGGFAVAARESLRFVHPLFGYLIWPVGLLAVVWSRRTGEPVARLALSGSVFFAVGCAATLFVALVFERPIGLNVIPVVEHPLFGAALVMALLGVLLTIAGGVAAGGNAQRGRDWPLLSMSVVPLAAVLGVAWGVWAEGRADDAMRLSGAYLVAQAAWPALLAPLLSLAWLCSLETSRGTPLPLLWRYPIILVGLVPALAVVWAYSGRLPQGPDGFRQVDLVVSWSVLPVILASGMALLCAGRGQTTLLRSAFPVSWGLALLAATSGLLFDETNGLFLAQVHWFAGALLLAYQSLRVVRGSHAAGAALAGGAARRVWPLVAAGMLLLGAGLGRPAWAEILGRLGLGADALATLKPIASAMSWAGALLVLAAALPAIAQRARDGRMVAWFRQWPALEARWRAVFATVALVALLGGAIALLPVGTGGRAPAPGSASDQNDHAVAQTRAEVAARFDQGVAMLRAHRYDDAATAFHRVLALSPEMPEAHVNMGFAMLGKQDFQLALDFFEGATELRADQLNAYYGMALALEGLGRLDAAAGAMRTYQHLTSPDDPFLPKVNEKLKEYESRRGRAGAATG